MEVLYNYNLNLLLFFYLIIFFVLFIKYVFFSLKILPEFFLIFFCLNGFFILFRFLRILSNNISLIIFLEISCLFSFVYLLILIFIRFKKNNKRGSFSSYFLEIIFIKKTAFFLIEFYKIFDSYFLNKFKNLDFLEWISFFKIYFREISFEKHFLNFYIIFLFLTIIFFQIDFVYHNICYSLMLWFFFNLFYRFFFTLIYFFHLYLKFSLTLFLYKREYFTEILDQKYFYSFKWRSLFKNWANRDLEQVLKTSEFTYTNYLWIDFKRLDLFLPKLSTLKKYINVFFAFFFIVNFLSFFFEEIVILLILKDLNYFCLLLFFAKIFIFRVNFFQDNATRSYFRFLFVYNWWLKNNKYGYSLYVSPPGPFFRSFLEKIRK